MQDKTAEMFSEISRMLGEHKGMLDQILLQTQKTNGRVTKCEERLDGLENKHFREEGEDLIKKKQFRYGFYALSAGFGAIAGQGLQIAAKYFGIIK